MYRIRRMIDIRKRKEWIHARNGFDYGFIIGGPLTRIAPHRILIRNNKYETDCQCPSQHHPDRKEYDTVIERRVLYPSLSRARNINVYFGEMRDACCSMLYLKDGEFVKGYNHEMMAKQHDMEDSVKGVDSIEEWIAWGLLHLDLNIDKFLQPFKSKDFPLKYSRSIENILHHDSGKVFEKISRYHERAEEIFLKEKNKV